MKKLKLIRKIGFSLHKLTLSPEAASLATFALQLFQHYDMIDEACQIYQKMIDEAKVATEKSKMYEDYSNYCKGWGRREKALELLQKKQAIDEDNYEAYSYTITLINQVLNEDDALKQQVKGRYQSWQKKPEEDPALDKLLKDLEEELQVRP